MNAQARANGIPGTRRSTVERHLGRLRQILLIQDGGSAFYRSKLCVMANSRIGRRQAPSRAPTVRRTMDLLDLMQWPAMLVTLLASWLVASRSAGRRHAGFWLFLASNALWVAWGWHASAYALIALQIGLAGMNIRGALKTESPS
jgi:hypothetical protein